MTDLSAIAPVPPVAPAITPAVAPSDAGPARRTVMAGAAAVAAAATVLTTAGPAAARPAAPHVPADAGEVGPDTLVARVRAGSHDQVTVYAGDHEVTVTDRSLVRALLSAAQEGTR